MFPLINLHYQKPPVYTHLPIPFKENGKKNLSLEKGESFNVQIRVRTLQKQWNSLESRVFART